MVAAGPTSRRGRLGSKPRGPIEHGSGPVPVFGVRPEMAAGLLRRRVLARPTWLPVVASSMGGEIPAGGEMLVVRSSRPRLGEAWAFCDQRGILVVGRFAGRDLGEFRFEREAGRPVQPVQPELVVGRVARLRRGGRERRLGERDRIVAASRLLARRGGEALVRLTVGRVLDAARAWSGARR